MKAGLWFRTSGCSYDAHGGCLMCDYSNGPATSAAQMISYAADGLNQIPRDCCELLISPSGSMLDVNEVPRDALIGILNLLAQTDFKRIMFETRAETITEEVVELCRSFLGTRFFGLFVGLESVSQFVLKHCINKQLQISSVLKAIKVCKKHGVSIMGNVLVGAAYLTVEESVRNSVDTVCWALLNGVDRCDLFPIHVKQNTPLAALYKRGLYKPPSLWSLVEVLNRLGEHTWPSVGLSWYTSYGAYNIIESPATCPSCIDKVISYLDGFVQSHSVKFINKLNEIKCVCRDKFNQQQHMEEDFLPARVLRGYKVMSEELMGDNWWQNNCEIIKKQVFCDWTEGGGTIAV